MFYTSEKTTLSNQVYQFIPTDLSEDCVFGWTVENNNQNEIEIHHRLTNEEYITTLIHELIHVDQNVRGLRDEEERENEAYSLEHTLTKQFLNKC